MSPLHEVRRLRIRPGPGAGGDARTRMLTEVAHQLLGVELDEALDGLVGDDEAVEIADVRVRLEVETGDTDTHALAVRWAGLVRAEVVRALAGAPRHAPESGKAAGTGGTAGPDAGTPGHPAARVADLAAVLAALVAGAAPGPADLRALTVRATDDAITVEALGRLPRAQRGAALTLLGAAGVAPPPTLLCRLDLSSTRDREDPPSGRGPLETTAVPDRPVPGSRTEDARPEPVPRRATDDPAYGVAGPDPASGPALSAFGGLVLLHHRLRPLLECAVEDATHADPVAVRLEVLALLARPAPVVDDARPVRDDPLLRLLAGDPGWLDRPAPPPADIPVDQQAADDVLRAFAADLPGFADSTPGFVRAQWLDRRALLVPDHDAVLLRLGPRPLDLLLDRLPYPVGALRLPWTPTLLVGWEGA